MNTLIKVTFVVLMALVVSGCAPQVIYVPTPIGTLPREDWLLPTAIEPPPNRQKYLATDDKGREALMTNAYIKQTQNLTVCNIDKAGLRQWRAEQKALLDKAQQEK